MKCWGRGAHRWGGPSRGAARPLLRRTRPRRDPRGGGDEGAEALGSADRRAGLGVEQEAVAAVEQDLV
ncbi:MAG: hypothetical protein R6W76_22600, partial [Caldilinea sp.]